MQRCVVVTAALLCLLAQPAYAQQPNPDAEIRAAIAKLHSDSADSTDFSKEFETFYRFPGRSAELLIADLKPIRRGRYRKHPAVVWDIRALRSLTGLDFRATTNEDLDADEKHFLDADANQQVLFFGTWMSRDSCWVAPRDAQVAIIQQWRDWFHRSGRQFRYVNDRNPDHWYF